MRICKCQDECPRKTGNIRKIVFRRGMLGKLRKALFPNKSI